MTKRITVIATILHRAISEPTCLELWASPRSNLTDRKNKRIGSCLPVCRQAERRSRINAGTPIETQSRTFTR
ncbi:MAG: hypothetical protein IJU92_04610 [Spirochaetaceae bacterium]|nr:hypothetical protein [Spirochaetaceae bacterium]